MHEKRKDKKSNIHLEYFFTNNTNIYRFMVSLAITNYPVHNVIVHYSIECICTITTSYVKPQKYCMKPILGNNTTNEI